jgi:hypothetical protein
MPSIDLTGIPTLFVRPAIIVVLHIPLLIVVLSFVPSFVIASIRPTLTRRKFTLEVLADLRVWSKEIVAGTVPRKRS